MAFQLASAQPHDVARIAQIHMDAFGTNALIQAIYPTNAVREGLTHAVVVKALADIQDPHITVLVVRYIEDPRAPVDRSSRSRISPIVGFAKWAHPVPLDDEYIPTP
jgi:hypothetical protein